MASFNKVIVIGNLTRDPEIRYTSAGKAVANVSLAINRKSGDKDETTFVEITVWEKQAEVCGQFLFKGSPAMFEGRLQTESWQDKESGAKRSKLVIIAEKVVLLGNKQDNGGGIGYEDQQPPSQPQRQQHQQAPQRQQQRAPDNGGFGGSRQAPPIPDNAFKSGDEAEDDIPF
jgi:single-strand DNA-binding protein